MIMGEGRGLAPPPPAGGAFDGVEGRGEGTVGSPRATWWRGGFSLGETSEPQVERRGWGSWRRPVLESSSWHPLHHPKLLALHGVAGGGWDGRGGVARVRVCVRACLGQVLQPVPRVGNEPPPPRIQRV